MREHRFVLVALLSCGLAYAGCAAGEMVGGNAGKGGSSSSGTGGKGGSSTTSGSGGSSTTSGSGGTFSTTTGAGGTFSTTGAGGIVGTTGAGGIVGTTGAGGTTGLPCSPTPPSMALVTDFATTMPGTGTTAFTYAGGVMGGATSYGGAAGPTITASAGAMHIAMNTAGGAAPQYVGAVLYFNGCVDASAFRGVHFKIGGTVSGCTIQYSTNDSPHTSSANDPKGVCTAASCYAPQKPLDTIPATPTDTTVLWADATAAGSPATPVEAGRVTAIQWQFTIPMGAGTCAASITIDDVGFVQ